jgi:hypothetical protein
MSLLKNILTGRVLLLFALFISVHLLLFNINQAEWGDSYKILTAAQYIKHGFYPITEKRPPLLSTVLALQPSFINPISFGRVILLIFSVLCFIAFYKLVKLYVKSDVGSIVALLLFIFNPVYLYWSLRIYADIPFTLFIMVSAYLFGIWKEHLSFKRTFVLGVLSGCAILLRFEGYLMLFALIISILLLNTHNKEGLKNIFPIVKKNTPLLVGYVGTVLVFVIPYILFRNPLKSSYLAEPVGRTYDLKMVIIFFTSLLFLSGVPFALTFFIAGYKKMLNILYTNTFIFSFSILELLLILVWPAAIPRLFVTVIPFYIIFMVIGLMEFLDAVKIRLKVYSILNFVLIGVYILLQYWLKLQFLIVIKPVFFVIISCSVLLAMLFHLKNIKATLPLLSGMLLIWSFATIWIHKDIYRTIKEASQYAAANLSGTIGYNDINAVASWYLTYGATNNIQSVYYKYEDPELLTRESLMSQKVNYIILTNENDKNSKFKVNDKPFIELLREFKYTANGGNFTSNIYKVNLEK